LKIAGEEKSLSSVQLLEWYAKLINEHPIISIEDGFAEDDWQGFTDMMRSSPCCRQAGWRGRAEFK